MSPEAPGYQSDPPSVPVEAAKSGPLTPDDIVGLTDEERKDAAIKQACDEFCKRFEDFDDPMVVREAIRKADPEITKDELLQDMDRLEAAAREHLPPSETAKPPVAEVEGGVAETPEARSARLGKFVDTHFSDVCPPEYRDAGTKECIGFEDDYRVVFDDPTMKLTDEDAADPELKEKIIKVAAEVAANDETITELTEDRDREAAVRDETRRERDRTTTERTTLEAEHPDIPTDESGRETMLASLTSGNDDLRVDRDQSEDRNETVTEDLTTIKQVQARFEQLKAEKGGTVPALRSLLEDGTIKSPEIKAKVENAIATAEALISAIPGKSEVISRIIDQSSVNLAGGSPIQIFAGFLAAADQSNELTEEEKTKLREVLHGSGSAKTGSDIKEAMAQGRGVREGADGKPEIIPYTEEDPLEVREGVTAYPAENGDFIMTAQMPDGRVLKFNVGSDGIDGEDVGQKINAAIVSMSFARKGNPNLNQQGIVADQGGGVIDINDVAFGTTSEFAQNVMKHFVGGLTGRDGEIMSTSDIKKLDRVAQWLSQEKGDFFGGEDGGHGRNDFAPRATYLQQIGLINEDGSIGPEENFALIGAYVQPKIGTGDPDYSAVLAYYRSEKGIE